MSMDQYLGFPVTNRQTFLDYRKGYLNDFNERYPKNWEDIKGKARHSTNPLTLLDPMQGTFGFYSMLRNWMGTESVSYLLYDDPRLVEECIEFLCEYILGLMQKAISEIEFDLYYIHQDMCYNAGPLLSLKTFRSMFLAYYKKFINFLKSHGVKVVLVDTDGNFDRLIPLFLEAGVDGFGPIEIAVGMDPVRLRKEYGQSLFMVGGIDKHAIAGGKREIQEELKRRIEPILDQGGFIPSIDHSIPPSVSQDNLYAGCEFTLAGGVPANRIARWDGKSWNALGSGLGGDAPTIADMEADRSGNLYVTGQFDTAGDIPVQLIARWDGTAWSDLAPGTRSGWFEGEFGSIFDLSVGPYGDLYAGGSFRTIYGVVAHNIARWDGASWTALSTPAGNGVNERVFAVTVDEREQVFAGGFFTNGGGLPANHIARWDGTAWFTWIEGGESGVDNIVDALAVDRDGILYAGGYFTTAGKAPANHIASWDGKEWSPLGKGLDAPVRDLALDSRGNLYAGGAFTTAGDVNVNRIARWDGTTWSAPP